MKTVNEVSKLTGITVRTLHYYDEIGLLSPTTKTNAGYRLYDDEALKILQQILFFRELDFSLTEIKQIITASSFDVQAALKNHKELLILKREHIDDLIKLVDKTIKEEKNMSFEEFDVSRIDEYKEEVIERWGNTEQYKQSMEKSKKYSDKDFDRIQEEANIIYKQLADNMDKEPSDRVVQELVEQWQNHISRYYYDCSNEMLANLGQMYVADIRFKENIDKVQKGLAEFLSKAIEIYTK